MWALSFQAVLRYCIDIYQTGVRMRKNGKPQFWRILQSIWLFLTISACGSSPAAIPTPVPTETGQIASLANTIRIANGEWIPYNSEFLQHNGCDSWAVAEAFALKGITVEYGFFPWARSYHLALIGEWDGTLAWADTPDHRKEFYLSAEPTSIQEWVFFYRTNDDFDWQNITDLRGKRIGITAGYVYSDVFVSARNDPDMLFEEAASDQANFKKLLNGHIDIFPLERQVGLSILANSFTPEQRNQITYHQKAITAFEPYLLLSRQNPTNEQRVELFNAGWKQLKESGRYTEIQQTCTGLKITPK